MTDSKPLRLLHLSDLHFGRIEDRVLRKLESYITNENHSFDMAILTGDLTQRAKSAQFIAAKEFLAKLKSPLFLVPGNHDVPLYNLFIRFFNPYAKFNRHFGEQANRYYENERLAIYGLWTVNNLKVQEGTVDAEQIEDMEEKFKTAGAGKIRIVAFHHPLAASEHSHVEKAMQRILALKPHVMMWGHDHKANAKYWDASRERGPVMVAAGTSVSNRTREESNSFNIIEVVGDVIKVRVVAFDTGKDEFQEMKDATFEVDKIMSLPLGQSAVSGLRI
jgi:3',5'-cyclic AMP phosphodiesterase CpdA